MVNRWLEKRRSSRSEKAGAALVEYLNQGGPGRAFLETFVVDARVVFLCFRKYRSLRELLTAAKAKKVSVECWQSHRRLNETLLTFTHAPQVDPHEFYDGRPLTWSMATEESPIALVAPQLRTVLELFETGAIERVRKCTECSNWLFARSLRQQFCSDACRGRHFATTEEFKEKRRKYMREYYRVQKSGRVR